MTQSIGTSHLVRADILGRLDNPLRTRHHRRRIGHGSRWHRGGIGAGRGSRSRGGRSSAAGAAGSLASAAAARVAAAIAAAMALVAMEDVQQAAVMAALV